MQMIPWSRLEQPGQGLARIRDEVDRSFNRLFNDPFGLLDAGGVRAEGWIPPLDVSDTDNEVTVRVEVPGIDAENLDITVTGRTLCIAGHKQEENERRGENFFQTERRFGSFRRMVELPESVDPDKVTAESDNGVVTIHVPKRAGAQPRQIAVRPSASAAKPVATGTRERAAAGGGGETGAGREAGMSGSGGAGTGKKPGHNP